MKKDPEDQNAPYTPQVERKRRNEEIGSINKLDNLDEIKSDIDKDKINQKEPEKAQDKSSGLPHWATKELKNHDTIKGEKQDNDDLKNFDTIEEIKKDEDDNGNPTP